VISHWIISSHFIYLVQIWNILPLGYYSRVCLSQIIPQGGLVSGMKSLSLAERTLVLATIHCVPPEFSISHAPPFFYSCRPIFWVLQYCIFEPAKSFKGYNNSPQSAVSPCEIHTFIVQGKRSMGLFKKLCCIRTPVMSEKK
jgi:hypothetical protein